MADEPIDPDEARFNIHQANQNPILLAQQQRDGLDRVVYRLDSLRSLAVFVAVLLGLILWRVW